MADRAMGELNQTSSPVSNVSLHSPYTTQGKAVSEAFFEML